MNFQSNRTQRESVDVKFHFTCEYLIIDAGSPSQEKLRSYLGTILGKYYSEIFKNSLIEPDFEEWKT